MKARLQTYLRWILPVIFILYLGEIVSFTHVHIVNGVTIVHSHPSQDQDGQHKHSLQELQLFHSLSTIVVEDGAVAVLSLFDFIPSFLQEIETQVSGFLRKICFYFLSPAGSSGIDFIHLIERAGLLSGP